MPYDVFISYRRSTGADDARLLQQALKARGYEVFFDYDSLRDGQFDEKILAAVDEAPVFVLMMTEGALDRCAEKGDWVRTEIERALAGGKRIVPVAPSSQRWSFPAVLPDSLRRLPAEQVSELNKTSLFERSIDQIVEDRFPEALRKNRRPADSIFSTVSSASAVFVGRDMELSKLHELLAAGKFPVISGPGGTGKSELARHYAKAFRTDYPGGLFQLDMDQVADWTVALVDRLLSPLSAPGADVRGLLGLGTESGTGPLDASAIIAALNSRAERTGRILLVLDNVVAVRALLREPILERLSLHPDIRLLATARAADVSFRPDDRCASFPLEDLSPEMALNLLLKDHPADSDDERTAASEVAKALGFRVLYLRAIPALLDDPFSPYAGSYVRLEKALRSDLLTTVGEGMDDAGDTARTPESLWGMTRRTLLGHPGGSSWTAVAHLAAFFRPEGFQKDSLLELWRDRGTTASRTSSGESDFHQTLSILAQHGVLDIQGNLLRMHRLTRAAVRRSACEEDSSLEEDLSQRFSRLAARFESERRLPEAEDFAVAALEILRRLRETNPEVNESSLASALFVLAGVHYWNNRLEESEGEYGKALIIRRKLAEANPDAYESDVATTLDNLADLHHVTNRLEAAEREYGEALIIRRKLAEANPDAYESDVATTLDNLADLHRNTNRLETAEWEYEEALTIRRKLAEANPDAYESDVATTLNGLAGLHRDTNRLEAAEREYGEALTSWRKLAAAHPEAYEPDVAHTLNNLAALHQVTQRLAEAEAEYAEALTIRRKLAEAHPDAYEPDVATTLDYLADLHRDTNRLEAAEQEYGGALTIRRKLAEAHPDAYEPDVATTLTGLALLHRHTNRLSEAEEEYAEALEIRRKLAAAHPEVYEPAVAMTLNNLAGLHSDTQRLAEAGAEYAEALAIYRKLATAHPEAYEPSMATILNNLAVLHSDTQRLAEAEGEYAEALAIRRKLAAANRDAYEPDVATTLNNLAALHQVTQRLAEAEAEYAEALTIRRKLAEANPEAYEPDVAMTLNNLAVLHSDTQRLAEAEGEYAEALAIRRKLAAANPEAYEPDMATTLTGLAFLHKNTNRSEKAEREFQEALSVYLRCDEKTSGKYEKLIRGIERTLNHFTPSQIGPASVFETPVGEGIGLRTILVILAVLALLYLLSRL